jgi:hypothetical protein
VPQTPGSYNIPVELRITAPGSTAAPIDTSAPYEVVNPPGGIVSDAGGALTLGSYCLPENRIKKGDSFQAWPREQLSMQHPSGTTYLGDTILADLAVATPTLPDPSDILVSAYLTSATATHPDGYLDGTKWLVHDIFDPMNITRFPNRHTTIRRNLGRLAAGEISTRNPRLGLQVSNSSDTRCAYQYRSGLCCACGL